MRFWQKTYLWTLVLFLVCLNAGIFSLVYYTYHQNVKAAEDACRAEYDYIARSFARDYADMQSAEGDASPVLLMQSYITYYGARDVRIAFFEESDAVISSLGDVKPLTEPDTVTQVKVGGRRYVVIRSTIEDIYDFVYAKNVSSLDREFRSLAVTFVAISAGISALLAISMYFVLKKLSVPLEKLRQTTEQIAGGDFSVTADETGKDEVAMLAKSFNIMVERIRDQMDTLASQSEKKQMLVDNMAHELRTPLTVIHGYAEYIEKAAAAEEDKIDAAKSILSEAERLQKISEKILDTAYIRHGDVPMAPIDLAVLLSDTAERLKPKANERGISFVLQTEKAAAKGDETLLSMLFYNLIENAVKAAPQNGTVTLSCSGGTVSVSDHGKGMTEEQLSHITEPFYRTDKSRSRAEGGAGLGLALCRQIAESHGAALEFESKPDFGTTVRVKFSI